MVNERYKTEARFSLRFGDEYYVLVDSELEKDIGYFYFKDQAERIANELNSHLNLSLDQYLSTSSIHK